MKRMGKRLENDMESATLFMGLRVYGLSPAEFWAQVLGFLFRLMFDLSIVFFGEPLHAVL